MKAKLDLVAGAAFILDRVGKPTLSFLNLVALLILAAVAVQATGSNLTSRPPAEKIVSNGVSTAARPGTGNSATAEFDPAQKGAALRDRLSEAERRVLIQEARSDIEDAAYARLEIIMAGFGALITALVVGFGIATYLSAANAARAELANVKERVEDLQREAEEATARSVSAAASAGESAVSASASAEQARTHERSAQQDSVKIREVAALAERQIRAPSEETSPKLSPAEQESVADAAREVADKPEREWTADDFKVKILEADSRGEWTEVRRLGRGMGFLFREDPALQAHARFAEAKALEDSGESDKAVVAYGEMAEELSAVDNPEVQIVVAKALVNQSILLGRLDKEVEAASVAEAVVKRYEGSSDEAMQELVATALVNRGVMLGRLGKEAEESESYSAVVKKFVAGSDVGLQTQVALAMYNSAISLGNKKYYKKALNTIQTIINNYAGFDESELNEIIADSLFYKAALLTVYNNVSDCIEALDEWKAKVGSFDCERVISSNFFSSMNKRSSFIAYLKLQGCDPQGPFS